MMIELIAQHLQVMYGTSFLTYQLPTLGDWPTVVLMGDGV